MNQSRIVQHRHLEYSSDDAATQFYAIFDSMGMFKQKVKVSNLKNAELFFEEDFWVNTGALYSFIPEDLLERIKAEPVDSRNIILADGRTDKRLIGFCNFQIEGLKATLPCPVIFTPKNSLFLLGATALENFCVDADPTSKKFKPIAAIIGGFTASL